MKSARPIIGVTADIDDAADLCSVDREYNEVLWQAGGLPFDIGPVCSSRSYASAVISEIDGLVISGGGDIDPACYGWKRTAQLIDVHPRRDAFEKALVAEAYAADIPVLGICRGMQMMNVALGGTLIQDIPTHENLASRNSSEHEKHVVGQVDHKQEKPYDRPTHDVVVFGGTLLRGLYRREGGPSCVEDMPLPVNSMHHQAICETAPCFAISAVCGKTIEAIEDRSKAFFLGVQWHPEYLANGLVLFEALCDAARKRRRKARS